jgi:hypothetical protein
MGNKGLSNDDVTAWGVAACLIVAMGNKGLANDDVTVVQTCSATRLLTASKQASKQASRLQVQPVEAARSVETVMPQQTASNVC